MRRSLLLVFVAIITISVILYIKRPELVFNLWIWVIGLAGPIVGIIKKVVEKSK